MTKSKTKVNAKRLPIFFQIDAQKFSENGEIKTEIHVLPVGKWNHPAYGPIIITSEDIAQFKRNFDQDLRKGIPITEGHEVMDEKPAVGWFKELIDRGGNGLYAVIEWTEKGKTLLSEKSYKYFSPEFYSEYEDPQTRVIHENVLVGGALTNKPYFKELEAIVMSEKSINSQFNFNENMNLQEILAKNVADLTGEERTFLKENKEQLTEDQLSSFGSVFEDDSKNDDAKDDDDKSDDKDGDDKGDDDKGDDEGDDKGDDADADADVDKAGDDADDSKVDASEFKVKGDKIEMSTAVFKALQHKANSGYDASEKLRKSDIQAEADKLIFSEQNSGGKFLPKEDKKIFSFMLGLTATQRKAFSEIVNTIPDTKIFGETGHGGNADGSATKEVANRAEKMMSENKDLQYADAISQIFSEDKDLATRYEKEL